MIGANGWFGDVLSIGDSEFTLEDGAEQIELFQVSEAVALDCPCINPDWIDPFAMCPMIMDPVIGCDGVEYSNACVAQAAGVTSYTNASGIETILAWDCGLFSSVIGACDNEYEGCTNPLADNYDSSALTDDGSCQCGDSNCFISVTVSVDMSLEGVVEGNDVKTRISTVNGDYNPSDWYIMDDSDGDLIYTYTFTELNSGTTYGYNFNDENGNGYESGDNLDGVCAEGLYGNDRILVAGTEDLVIDVVCWESCESCPEFIYGCTDENAVNFDPLATDDDGSCISDWPEPANLFFSEYAEGSSNNKYLEIYNASNESVDLSGYSLSSCSNGCDDGVNWDYPDNVTFNIGTILEPGDVYVVCHGSSAEPISLECDQEFTFLSNGDDVFALTQIGSGTILDIIGAVGEDPGSGWDVAGVTNGTKDHTLVRKCGIETGNPDWIISSGTNLDDSEWLVFEQNEWSYLGYHELNCVGCTDPSACNYDPTAIEDNGSCGVLDDCGVCQVPYCYEMGGNIYYVGILECQGGVQGNSIDLLMNGEGVWVGTDSSDDFWLGSVYNPYWNESCIPTPGCTDNTAINYWYAANIDDGSCYYTCAEAGLADLNIYMSTSGTVPGWYGSTITIGDNEYSLVQPNTSSIQEPSSSVAIGLKLNAVGSVHPSISSKLHTPSPSSSKQTPLQS